MLMQKLRDRLRFPVRNERGMTLIEIMIVLTIMAAVMAGVMVSINSGRQNSNINRTRTMATTVLGHIETERILDPRAQPSIDALGLAESQTMDAWGNKFQVEYSGRGVKVISGGPDGSIGGTDDVVVTNE